MGAEGEALTMLRMLFGEAAEAAQRGASERLMRWAEAFEAWLAELEGRYKPQMGKQAALAWRRLFQQQHKMPWELTKEDFEQQARWMLAEGYSPATAANTLGFCAKFYRWCGEKGVDPETGCAFNPAQEARRPKVRRYRGASLLSREEAARLLRVMEMDTSALGKRDYAFMLARLRLGAPLSSLQRLRWGDVEQEEGGAWVRWRVGAERQRLPDDVWEAALRALEASGRLAGMRAGEYLFAPLAFPFKEETGSKAEDWLGGQYLSTSQILRNLKVYGRLAGIAEEKLTLMALRRTATRLRLDEGASVEEMKRFMDSDEEMRFTKYRLSKLPDLPANAGREEGVGEAPRHKAKPFQPGEGMVHGLYAGRRVFSQPPEAVRRVLEENIQGMDEEVVGMRILERGLVERLERAKSNQEAAQLWEAYSLMALRTSMVFKAERELAEKGKGSQKAEEFFAELDRLANELGIEPSAEEDQTEAPGADEDFQPGRRQLVEEMATLRYGLRNVFRLAMEAEDSQEYIRMVELYSSTCVRFMRLSKLEYAGGSKVEEEIVGAIQQAIDEVSEEMGLS